MTAPRLLNRLRPPFSRQFSGDFAWNLASFAVMALAGLALNVLIASFYDAATLGVFNQVYTVYILLSQVAVAGIHLSVLRAAAAESAEADHIMAGALIAAMVVATPVSLAAYGAAGFVGDALDSGGVAAGIRVAAPGIALFALNKVLLAFHNALARLRPFAVFQSLRFVFMTAALIGLATLHLPGERLPMRFTVAEGALLLVLVAFTMRTHALRFSAHGRRWMTRHFRFGARAIWGNLLADVNTRVDIIVLGLFTPDRVVGIYSFAALIAEGFAQLAIVFRNVVNPYLARYREQRTTAELESRLRQGIRMAYAWTLPGGVALVAAYPLAVRLLGDAEYAAGWPAFAVLMAGIMASMGYTAFQMLLNQGGFPGAQSWFFALTFVTNLVLNLVLIPPFDMLGSAIATALSFVLSIAYLRTLVWRVMRVRM